jgi:hypothetical protein
MFLISIQPLIEFPEQYYFGADICPIRSKSPSCYMRTPNAVMYSYLINVLGYLMRVSFLHHMVFPLALYDGSFR